VPASSLEDESRTDMDITKTTAWDSAEYLKTEADIATYLDACFEEGGDDPAFLAHALGVAARARIRAST
jgi:probable addiction module antidote protein